MTNGSSDSFRMCYIISSATGICLICVHSLRVIDTSDFGVYSIQYIRIICCVLILETIQQSRAEHSTAHRGEAAAHRIRYANTNELHFGCIRKIFSKQQTTNANKSLWNFCCQFVHFTSSIYYWVEMYFQVQLVISLKPILKDYLFKTKNKKTNIRFLKTRCRFSSFSVHEFFKTEQLANSQLVRWKWHSFVRFICLISV